MGEKTGIQWTHHTAENRDVAASAADVPLLLAELDALRADLRAETERADIGHRDIAARAEESRAYAERMRRERDAAEERAQRAEAEVERLRGERVQLLALVRWLADTTSDAVAYDRATEAIAALDAQPPAVCGSTDHVVLDDEEKRPSRAPARPPRRG